MVSWKGRGCLCLESAELLVPCRQPSHDPKGLVINYGEGGGGYKMGKSQARHFLRPPQDRVKLFVSPLLKSGDYLRPPSILLKLQATT